MLMGYSLLVRAESLINSVESKLNEYGFDSQVELSPEDRDPRSISWIVEGEHRMSQIVLWEDGQSEIELAEVETGQVISEHHKIEGESAVTALIDSVKLWLLEGVAGGLGN